ncbi:PREDICTED: fractalkine [Hipposideros armiger]|uniref:Fractalkine n=1 Tax=Hipposideros armiger TaxID=186990 RepID=A0A8B7TEX8_HIPAR|nr:PREDICTED: fractalkine [Hipposideros armiger]
MAPPPLSWLLRLAVLCHLTMLLAGLQRASDKCSMECDKMHSKAIPLSRLIKYERNQQSCLKRAIIFETVKHAFFCADPEAEWVQEAIKYLDRKATTTPLPNGVVEKRIGDPRTSLTPRGINSSAVSEPKTTRKSRNQETEKPLGTSPELPTRVPGSWRSTSPMSPDGQPPTGPKTTTLYNSAAVTTTTSRQSSTTYQPERKAPEVTSAQAPSSQTLTLPTQALPTQALRPQVPSIQTLPHDAPSAHRNAFVGPSSIPHVSVVPTSFKGAPSSKPVTSSIWAPKHEDPQAPTRRQAVGLLAFLGLLFCLGVAMFAYQSLQACHFAGDMVEGLRYVPRSCGSNSYVLVPV